MPAEVELTFAPVSGRSANGSAMPAFDSEASGSETLTTASTPSIIAAGSQDFARFVNSGDQGVYVALKASGTSASTPRFFLGVGQTLILNASEGARGSFTPK